MTESDALGKYGEIVNDVWSNEAKFCSVILVPDDISPKWINSATGKPTTKIYCNKDLAVCLFKAFKNIRDRKLISQLKTFDGCFCIRDIRGVPGQMSAHSYAIAIDINASTNKLGTPGDMTQDLAQCFLDAGLVWGKNFSRSDPMHMSLGF